MLYKKTDSTLRGNILPEFEAILAEFPESQIMYAPAYPAMGRTVRGGLLYVDGIPVHQTPFASDPLNPIASSHVPSIPGVTVCDGETDNDVREIAKRALQQSPPALAAGPAALARAIAELTGADRVRPALPRVNRALVVNGSLNPVSVEQVRSAGESGCLPPAWTILNGFQSASTGIQRAREMGNQVAGILRSGSFDTLIVFGGDTAFGIMSALQVDIINPIAEILPGVPISRIEAGGRAVHVITKAGGFGPVDILERIRNVVQWEQQ
jgi:uncharacterized protein YgbK (DUF1537 family)